jgi:hypothetical protein
MEAIKSLQDGLDALKHAAESVGFTWNELEHKR